MFVHRLGCIQSWEHVDEAEQLHLERFILQRPLHELVLPETAGQQPSAMPLAGLQGCEDRAGPPEILRGHQQGHPVHSGGWGWFRSARERPMSTPHRATRGRVLDGKV